MEHEINDYEVLSPDSHSNSTTRPSSPTGSDMPKVNIQSQPINKQTKEDKSTKILTFNGKCSEIFKSTLEDCVKDCILEFPGEKNSIYVSKSGQAVQIPVGTNRHSMAGSREKSSNTRKSARSNRRCHSVNQYSSSTQMSSTRTNSNNHFSLSGTALAITAASRLRHQKYPIVDDITEESTDLQTIIEQQQLPQSFDQSKRSSIQNDDSFSPHHLSSSIPTPKTPTSYTDRQKDYRLSDLVMFGPEYYANVFKLRRPQSPSRQHSLKETNKDLTELDRIKQDLFHRYLWTKKPQVSSRIRPMSTYARSSTYVV